MKEQEIRRNVSPPNPHEGVTVRRLPVSGEIFSYDEVKSMLRHFHGFPQPPQKP